MQNSLLLILALVAPMKILSRHQVRSSTESCIEKIKWFDFSRLMNCGDNPALDIASTGRSQLERNYLLMEFISMPWGLKIQPEDYDCFWNSVMEGHDVIITAMVEYHECRGKRGKKLGQKHAEATYIEEGRRSHAHRKH